MISTRHAAVIIETVQGEGGINVPTDEWIRALRKKCNETGTLLILDEIQCGYGRTGRLFTFEHFDVVPDILLLAKGFGGGMPLGSFISSKKIMQALVDNPILGHITTFGGHPVCCAAGLATLEVLTTGGLIKDVSSKERLLRSLLIHPRIQEIRGMGLMLAVQLDSFELVERVMKECLADGLLIDWFLHNDSSLRIAPPLIITEEEIKKACKIILQALDQL